MPPRHIVSTIRTILKSARRLQEQLVLVPLRVDVIAKWCNSFVIVSGPIKAQPGTNAANTQGANIKHYTAKTTKCVLHHHF